MYGSCAAHAVRSRSWVGQIESHAHVSDYTQGTGPGRALVSSRSTRGSPRSIPGSGLLQRRVPTRRCRAD